MIRAVLWDLDGTLLNFQAAERAAVRRCFALFSLGECTDEMVRLYSRINVTYWEALERRELTRPEVLVGRFEEFFRQIGVDPALAEDFSREYENRLPDTVMFCPGALETVSALRGRVIQCAVTNGTKSVQQRKLRTSGLDALLDAVFISEDVGWEKPDRRFFAAVFRALGDIPPGDMLIVGDSLTSDIRGGVNALIPTAWYNPEGRPLPAEPRVDYDLRALTQVQEIVPRTQLTARAQNSRMA